MNVLVTGMHRSGTSAVANVLRQAGLFGWDDDDAMAASAENPDGYGERRDVMELNERLLGELGWGWDSPPAEPWAQPPTLDLLVEEGRRLVRDKLDDRGEWFIKDPRISLLLPWWRRVLLDRFVVLVVFRDPSEVAWSLSVRNAFPPSLGLALWDAYHRHLWAGLQGLPVVSVAYDALVGDPNESVGQLLAALTSIGVTQGLDEKAAVDVIRPSLRRATQPQDAATEGSWFPTAAWDVVRSTGGTVIDSFAMVYPPPDATEVALLDLQARGRGNDVVAQQNSLSDAVEQLRAELARTQEEHAVLAAQVAELERRQKATDENLLVRAPALVQRTRQVVRSRTQQLLGHPDASATLVDPVWYRMAYPDVTEAGMDPVDHYRRFGAGELRNPNPLFDTAWYLDANPDVREAGVSPLEHYHASGWREHRDPSSVFDTSFYLEANPDVAERGVDPLLHYLQFGAHEWRLPRADYQGLPIVSPGLVASAETRSLRDRTRQRIGRPLAHPPEHGRYPWTQAELDAMIPDGQRATVMQARDDYVAALPRGHYVPFVPPTARVLHYANATSAIARLESLRAEGVQYLVATATSLASLPTFAAYLDRYEPAHSDERYRVYRLERTATGGRESLTQCLDRVHGFLSAASGRQPAVLDLRREASPVLDATFRPPEPWHLENYLAQSVDVVVAVAGDDHHVDAERIARSAVVLTDVAGTEASATFLATDARLPSVSIIIPTFEHEELVRHCVTAIAETVPAELDVEVIVVDDASGSPISQAPLEGLLVVHPLRVLRNPSNLGFVGSINRGAAAARNEILLFLNNDTIPLAGWLEPILALFRSRADTGIVGAKLIYPDGRLQEAGGVVFSDASGANYGRGDANVESAEYSYVREVDYVSGAILATPRALFESAGGFATVYGFGYYEDSDYAFTLRGRGYVTLFQPRSAAVHLEGSSAGTDTSSGKKHYQVINREIFAVRWAAKLAAQPLPFEQWDAGVLVPDLEARPPTDTSAAA